MIDFFEAGSGSLIGEFLLERDIDYVFYGPRERLLGDLPKIDQLEQVYAEADIEIYQVRNP